jgi:hypothetical protein
VSADLTVGAPTTPVALARLCSAPDFAGQVWARRAWLSRAADLPGRVDDLFSLAAVDELLSRRALRTPFLRLAKDGRIVAPARYTGSGGVGAGVADQVRDDAVLELFADGTTAVLQGVHRLWPPVGALAADLAAELGHPVQVNSYVTPPQSQGFSPHYDTHDVFVLQVAGRKRWRVHAPVREAPLPGEDWAQVADEVRSRASEAPLVDDVLHPGDCLYLPRGFLHSAVALGETSAHLTFGVHPLTAHDVVRALVDQLPADGWRESLPAGFDPAGPDGAAVVEQVRDRLAAALASLDPAGVAATLQDRRSSQQRPEPLAPLAQAEAASGVRPDSPVRWRAHLGARLEPTRLVLPGRDLPLAEDERAAVERLSDGWPATPAQLPGVAGDAALALVRRLLRAGVLVPADDAGGDGAGTAPA